MSRHWLESEVALARVMLARGDDESAFQERFGKSKNAAQCRTERRPGIPSHRPRGRPRGFTPTPPNPDAVSDAMRRAKLLPASLTAALCHDPLPGYSALDRKRAEQRA